MRHEDFEDLNVYLKAVNSKDVRLNKDQELQYIIEAKGGSQRAMNILIGSNIKYIVSIAKRHAGCGVPIVDLVQEGVMMFMRAIEKFDNQANNNLRSYSAMYIQKGITDCIANQGRTVRLPMHKEFERYMDQKNGKDVSGLNAVRIDNKINEESANTMADLLMKSDPSIDQQYENDAIRDVVDGLLKRLDEREVKVLKAFFGIDREYALPAVRIAEEMNLSQPTVNAIINKSIDKLKGVAV